MSKLYHKNVFWKEDFNKEYKCLFCEKMKFSSHLKHHLYEDNVPRYNINPYELNSILNKIATSNIEPFEVELESNEVVKAVVRTTYNASKDICVVIRKGFVVTAWLNSHNDVHETMDFSRYETNI